MLLAVWYLQAIRASLLPDPPACLIIGDMKNTGSPAGNIQDLPVAPFCYGFSVSVCMSAALSTADGLGLGTLGFSEVSTLTMGHVSRRSWHVNVGVEMQNRTATRCVVNHGNAFGSGQGQAVVKAEPTPLTQLSHVGKRWEVFGLKGRVGFMIEVTDAGSENVDCFAVS